jgi:hypothetical protein
MDLMNPVVVQLGQVLLILLGIALGVIYNNRSIGHLDTRINDRVGEADRRLGNRIDHLSTRIDDMIRNQELRHNDLKDVIKSEVRRLDDRIARLEQPIIRS